MYHGSIAVLIFCERRDLSPVLAVSHSSQPAEPASVPALSAESDWDPACSGETELDRVSASTDHLGGSIVCTASGSIFQRGVLKDVRSTSYVQVEFGRA